jgi:hypothetical protein
MVNCTSDEGYLSRATVLRGEGSLCLQSKMVIVASRWKRENDPLHTKGLFPCL